jgi:hypothetical protein
MQCVTDLRPERPLVTRTTCVRYRKVTSRSTEVGPNDCLASQASTGFDPLRSLGRQKAASRCLYAVTLWPTIDLSLHAVLRLKTKAIEGFAQSAVRLVLVTVEFQGTIPLFDLDASVSAIYFFGGAKQQHFSDNVRDSRSGTGVSVWKVMSVKFNRRRCICKLLNGKTGTSTSTKTWVDLAQLNPASVSASIVVSCNPV